MTNSNDSIKRLARVLIQVGKRTKVFETPDGSRVLVLPYGGRVLGLFAPGSQHNFYWTHPALNSAESAREFYAGNHWHNSGGDRTWLAPEIDFFFPTFPKLDRYSQQRSVDPGHYRLMETKEGLLLVNRFTVNCSRSGKDLNLKIVKSISSAKNPLRYEHKPNVKNVAYAGYTQSTSLELTGTSLRTRDHVGIWNLIQMPHGGDLLIPTYSHSEPRHIFSTVDTIPPQDLVTTKHLIRYRMRQTGEHKISVRAVSVCGRIGYVYQHGGRWVLIVHNIMVNPSGEYVDVPWNETNDFGYAVQACNVNSALGSFSELEYHIPAIGYGTGCLNCNDTAQVWAFCGDKSQIDLITRTLLTPDPWATERR